MQVGYRGYGAGEISVIPSPEQSSGYGARKVSKIPRQEQSSGYENRKVSKIPRQVGQQESWEGVNSEKIE